MPFNHIVNPFFLTFVLPNQNFYYKLLIHTFQFFPNYSPVYRCFYYISVFPKNESDFLYFLFIKTELEQGRRQAAVLCCPRYPCRYARFQWRRFGFACCNAVKPRPRLPALRWSPGQSFHRAKGSDSPCESTSIFLCRSFNVLRI